MPFDTNFPPPNAELISAEWRAQLNALHDENVALEARVTALEAAAFGFITPATLNAAIATCAKNVDNFQPQGLGASDPPTQLELQSLMDSEANLIAALHR